jgi:hypothetical protein
MGYSERNNLKIAVAGVPTSGQYDGSSALEVTLDYNESVPVFGF